MKATFFFVTLTGALLIAGLLSRAEGLRGEAQAEPAPSSADKAKVVQGNNAFALALYGELRGEKGNLFFAPPSISTALAMTYAGAGGRTAEQMAQTLHFSDMEPTRLHPACAQVVADIQRNAQSPGCTVSVANSLWLQQGYPAQDSFLAIIKNAYGTAPDDVDFSGQPSRAADEINAWVGRETHRRIENLVDPRLLDPLTRLVLANAIYFKGTWVTRFEPTMTTDGPFWVSATDNMKARLMHQEGQFNYLEGDDFQTVEMPYEGGRLSMVVVLPRARDGLAALERSLTPKGLARRTTGLSRERVRVTLPRFRQTFFVSLGELLSKMGMPLAFREGEADFSGISRREGLYLSAVLHKAFVEVNEEGTEAAAATAVIGRGYGALPKPRVFCADHPFVFLIRDNASGSIVFLGRLRNPSG